MVRMVSDSAFIEQLVQTAHLAAWQAGQVIKQQNSQPRKVKSKGFRDLVTQTDLAAQLAAVKVITERFHDHLIYAEEDPRIKPSADGRWPIPDGVVWVIDPLDGTSNYVSQLPLVGVSVGAVIDGVPVAGAIYDPLGNELFEGGLGRGATLNGRPLQPLAIVALEDSMISMDFARDPEIRARAVASFAALSPRCRTLRTLGSAALALAYVAAGRLQAYLHFNLQPWDVGAGAVMIRETGGELRSPEGAIWQLEQVAVMAGHPELLDQIGAVIASAT